MIYNLSKFKNKKLNKYYIKKINIKMQEIFFNLNDKIYSNNNILIEIVNDLHQLMNYSNDNLIIKRLSDVIIKMNNIINENKKNVELIRKDISSLYNKLNKKFGELNFNNINNNQELNFEGGKYIGQVLNGLPDGKGIFFTDNGDRYEGDWKKGIKEGRGIYFWNNGPFKGDRYEGNYKNGLPEGKGIYYYSNGDRYEGDWKKGFKDGSGIKYLNNGDRRMGDYSKGNRVGKHVTLKKNGDVEKSTHS